MHKRLFRIFIVLATSIVLLAHTFVPHQHENVTEQSHEEHEGFKDLFTYHSHSSDCFTVYEKQEIGQSVNKYINNDLITVDELSLFRTYFKPVTHKVALYTCVYISPHHLVSLDFRGPPSLSV